MNPSFPLGVGAGIGLAGASMHQGAFRSHQAPPGQVASLTDADGVVDPLFLGVLASMPLEARTYAVMVHEGVLSRIFEAARQVGEKSRVAVAARLMAVREGYLTKTGVGFLVRLEELQEAIESRQAMRVPGRPGRDQGSRASGALEGAGRALAAICANQGVASAAELDPTLTCNDLLQGAVKHMERDEGVEPSEADVDAIVFLLRECTAASIEALTSELGGHHMALAQLLGVSRSVVEPVTSVLGLSEVNTGRPPVKDAVVVPDNTYRYAAALSWLLGKDGRGFVEDLNDLVVTPIPD